MKDGFVKVAAASPVIKVADCDYNAQRVIDCIREADEKGVKVLVFPELTLTGASCWDLFRHRVILDGAKAALKTVVEATKGIDMLIFVGLPLAVGTRIFSAAAVICNGEILRFASKEDCSTPGGETKELIVNCKGLLDPETLPPFVLNQMEGDPEDFPCFRSMTRGGIFQHTYQKDFSVAVEIGTDGNRGESSAYALEKHGATILCRMASFPATVTSTRETELNVPLLRNQGNNGGISVMDGWSAQRIYLSPAQEQLLQKLLPTLADDDKATMETILQKFCNPCSR